MARRVIIIGGPHVGKTILSRKLRDQCGFTNTRHSDDVKHLRWSESSEFASHWFSEPGDWVIEGVQMARALRKWLRANPDTPLDADVVLLDRAYGPLLPGQQAMAKGVATVFKEIQGDLIKRGVRIHRLSESDAALTLFQSDSADTPSGNLDNPLNPLPRDVAETSKGVIPRMAYKRNLTKAEWEQLPETTRTFFTEQKVYVADGENWKLDADDSEDVTKLSTAIKKEREARAQFEKDLKAEREKFAGFDLDRYNQLVADADAKETDELKSKGKIDELIEKGKLKEKSINDDWQKKFDNLMGEFNMLRVDHRLHKAFEDGGVIQDRIDDAVELTKKIVRLTDKGELEVLDKPGGSPMDASLEIYAKELLKEQKPWLYAATSAGGTGAQNGNGGGLPSGQDLSKLSATERLKYANRADAAK